MKRLMVFAVAILMVSLSMGRAASQEAKTADGKTAFALLKSLAGDWRGTGDGPDHHEGTVTYRVTSGGHSVVETLWAGSAHEMVSVFYLEGSSLVMTHYCSAGNQPHMSLDVETSTPGRLVFQFAGGTNLDPAKDPHVHSATIAYGGGHLEEHWMGYVNGKQANDEVFRLSKQ
jgi:hypothetical protein